MSPPASLITLPKPPHGRPGFPWTEAARSVSRGTSTSVSIITPSYNQAQFLEETILSVLSQDYANIEYIIIDGASTDGSIDTIRKYANRLARWVSEPDAGQADAINKGFRIASGDIITWLNSDDVYFTRDAVRKVVDGFAAQSDADIIYGDAATIDKLGYIRRVRCLPDFDRSLLLRTCYLVQPAVFFKAKMLERHQLDSTLALAFDYKLWLELAKDSHFVHIPYVIAGDRNHPGRKTVLNQRNAEQAEASLQLAFGARLGAGHSVRRFFDKVFAFSRRLKGIPLLLSIRYRQDLAFHARVDGNFRAIWGQVFGKDYQKF